MRVSILIYNICAKHTFTTLLDGCCLSPVDNLLLSNSLLLSCTMASMKQAVALHLMGYKKLLVPNHLLPAKFFLNIKLNFNISKGAYCKRILEY